MAMMMAEAYMKMSRGMPVACGYEKKYLWLLSDVVLISSSNRVRQYLGSPISLQEMIMVGVAGYLLILENVIESARR